MSLPNTRPGEWPELRPDRFAHLIKTQDPAGCSIGLLGLPFDGGVALNRGRVGAAEGPSAFRQALGRFAVSYDIVRNSEIETGVFDAGDIIPSTADDPVAALHETHQRVSETVGKLLRLGLMPVCIGGGHDLTLASARALSTHIGAPIGGLNIDAHLDVRAEVGSGMPFRALIEGGFLEPARFTEFGIGRFTSSAAHVQWLEERGTTIVDVDEAREDDLSNHAGVLGIAFDRAFGGQPGFLSVDLDAIDGAQAPGVSAVNPMGLDVSMVTRITERAGMTSGVRLLDIMELNPACDEDGRTARIAALLFMTFVGSFAERGR